MPRTRKAKRSARSIIPTWVWVFGVGALLVVLAALGAYRLGFADGLASGSTTESSFPIAEGGVVATEAPALPTTEPFKPVTHRYLVFVIDDVGFNQKLLQRYLTLPLPLTFAVLPDLPNTAKDAGLIRQAGQELILHQPLEPIGHEDPGPGLIRASMSQTEITQEFATNLASIPGLVGANNHMGSKGTQDPKVLRPLFEELRRRGLFFLDSRTEAHTAVRAVATEVGLPFLERDIFLDNVRTPEAIRQSLAQGLKVADRQGYAILIGHVWSPELIDVLREDGAGIQSKGYELTTLTKLLRVVADKAAR